MQQAPGVCSRHLGLSSPHPTPGGEAVGRSAPRLMATRAYTGSSDYTREEREESPFPLRTPSGPGEARTEGVEAGRHSAEAVTRIIRGQPPTEKTGPGLAEHRSSRRVGGRAAL